MKQKPIIRFAREVGIFIKDGVALTYPKAKEHWDSQDAEWSMGAYQEMSRRVMEPETEQSKYL
jgi:hypothetical protein